MGNTLKDFPRIQNAIRVKHLFDAAHQVQISFGQSDTNVAFLHQADAVLTRNGAAQLHSQRKYFGDWLAQTHVPHFVVEVAANDIDVQITVAGVAVAHALETVAGPNFLHAFQQRG